MDKYHVMLDLETMGTDTNAAIVAIGAVKFNRDGIGSTFYRAVDLQSSMDAGSTVTASTIKWWLNQSDAARNAVVGSGASKLDAALLSLGAFITPGPDSQLLGVWGNGAVFDNVILSSAYDRIGMKRPWAYHLDRCYRTVKALHPLLDMPDEGTAHNALDDALYQTRYLVALGVTGL